VIAAQEMEHFLLLIRVEVWFESDLSSGRSLDLNIEK
jgi:hypothetical protein